MTVYVQAEPVSEWCERIFLYKGVDRDVAAKVAGSLTRTSLAGIDSHGIVLLLRYAKELDSGQIRPDAVPTIEHAGEVILKVDGHFGFGHITASAGMAAAIDVTKDKGCCISGFQQTNHIGRVGEYLLTAAAEEIVALGFVNAGANVAPYGAVQRLLGTNPISCALPRRHDPPVLIDLATSIWPEGKVRIAMHKGESVDPGLLIDKHGRPTQNPQDLYDGGALLPIGGHKGSALSLMVEVLCGIMTGTGCAAFEEWPEGNGVVFITMDPSRFRPVSAFQDDLDRMIQIIKALPGSEAGREIKIPGEPELETAMIRKSHGIPIDDETWRQFVALSQSCEMPPPPIRS